MNVTINGEYVVVSPGTTIAEALKDYDLPRSFVIEINGEIIDNGSHAGHQLENGDTIEIIRFVGGG